MQSKVESLSELSNLVCRFHWKCPSDYRGNETWNTEAKQKKKRDGERKTRVGKKKTENSAAEKAREKG